MFFKNKKYEDWVKLEDKQIDKIMNKLKEVSDLVELEQDIVNMHNYLDTIKINRNPKIAEMLHKKAIDIDAKLKKLYKDFEEIAKESEVIEECVDEINKFYTLIIHNVKSGAKHEFEVEYNKPFKIGTKEIGYETISEHKRESIFKKLDDGRYYFSREHLELNIK